MHPCAQPLRICDSNSRISVKLESLDGKSCTFGTRSIPSLSTAAESLQAITNRCQFCMDGHVKDHHAQLHGCKTARQIGMQGSTYPDTHAHTHTLEKSAP